MRNKLNLNPAIYYTRVNKMADSLFINFKRLANDKNLKKHNRKKI